VRDVEHDRTVVVRDDSGERPIRIQFSGIDALSVHDTELTVALRDRTKLAFATPAAADLREAILAHCRALPELTHALRAFGSRRGQRRTRDNGPKDQQRFFAPLLDARRQAVRAAAPSAALAAFDSASLAAAVEQAVQAFAVERYGQNAPARRALEAELTDLSEPLRVALDVLRVAAETAAGDVDDLRLWRAWSVQLRATFEVADRVWLSLDAALDTAPWRL